MFLFVALNLGVLLQYIEAKERAGEPIVADCVRGAAEYVTKIFKVRS